MFAAQASLLDCYDADQSERSNLMPNFSKRREPGIAASSTSASRRGPGRPSASEASDEGAGVRERILAAAKIHFAQRGFELASIRQITEEAGVNTALISYYFGSKQQLYDEVIDDCAKQLNQPRLRMLDELERGAEKGGPALAAILYANISTFRPVLLDPHCDAAVYLRLYGRIYTEPTAGLLDVIARKFATLRQRYVVAIARAVPQIPSKDVYFRYNYMIGSLLHSVSDPRAIEEISGGQCTVEEGDAFWDDFVRTWCDIFRAPSSLDARAS